MDYRPLLADYAAQMDAATTYSAFRNAQQRYVETRAVRDQHWHQTEAFDARVREEEVNNAGYAHFN